MEDRLGEASTWSDRRIVGLMDEQALRNEIVRLAPWHLDVELNSTACRTTFWHQAVRYAPAGWGRFEVIAARDEALFENYDRVTQDGTHQQP